MVAVAVIFDLDGVLADSEPVHLAAEQAAVAAHGHELTKAAKRPFVGLANAEIMHGLIELFEIDATVDRDMERPTQLTQGAGRAYGQGGLAVLA